MAAEAYSLTRPHDDFNFEELLSDLTTIARMIRPHLGSRLVSARLTFGVHCCTLPREERCGRRTNPPTICASPRRSAEKTSTTVYRASEVPAADSGLEAVSLLKQHSLLARNTPLAASSAGSILLCNVESHASTPARSESWGVVDVLVEFTGLVRRPHRSSRGRVQQCTPKVSLALTSLDPKWGRIIRAIVIAQQLFKIEIIMRPG